MEKKQLAQLLQAEKRLYLGATPEQQKAMKKTRHKRYTIWKCLYYFRCSQYWRDIAQAPGSNPAKKLLARVLLQHCKKMRNIYTEKSGVEIGIDSVIGRNCDIWHGGVVINGIVGDDCVFHGNNIVGNKGLGRADDRPTIGNKVDIGAGAVVTKSFDQPGDLLVGIPARSAK